MQALAAQIKAQALAEGFTTAGICAPDAIPQAPERLDAWLAAGHHASMSWMQDRKAWRANPAALWPEARAILMLTMSYAPEHDPRAVLNQPDKGAISVYAQNRDYHDVIKKRLKKLGRWMIETAGGEIKVFVDTAPVMEKPLAQAAGLGWQGKHSNLVSRDIGNWFFIGAIFTTLDLPADPPEQDHCGSCRACLDICPTDAFPAPYQLDARRCISYLTIEHKGPVAPELRAKLGNHIYGCDDCLAACPWNKFAKAGQEAKLAARDDLITPRLSDLAKLDDAAFRTHFSGSAIKRIGRDRFIRNVAYAIGNSNDKTLIPALQPLLTDQDPAVADAARWATDQLI